MNNTMRAFILFIVALFLNGCGMLKSVFPDKEKDYRFTRELPALVIPEDLLHSEIVKTPVAEDPTAANELEPASDTETTPELIADTPTPVSGYAKDVAEADSPVETKISLQTPSNGKPLIHVNQNLQRTWRMLGKAMTLEALEIVERNAAENYYVVEYEPKVKSLKDDSIWDNVTFLFGAENNQEQAYRITLSEAEQQTDIQVRDMDDKVCEVDACVELTKLLKAALEKSLTE